MFKGITGNVLILGLVSLFTDISSEMIYPLLPLFLTTVLGGGPAFLGVIEGVAESTASLLKLVSGILSDRLPGRKKLVLAGYTISSLARPLTAVALTPLAVLFIRFADRVGKGIRTSPRDALIADSVDPAIRGKAFGFHRSMDHAGALIGPLIATLLLTWYSVDIRTVFWLAAIPGGVAVLLIILKVRDVEKKGAVGGNSLGVFPKGRLRTYLLSPLYLHPRQLVRCLPPAQGGPPRRCAGPHPASVGLFPRGENAFYHAVRCPVRPDRPARGDHCRLGGLCPGLYRLRLCLVRASTSGCLFAVYGLFYGLTEGVEKALLTDIAPPAERGSAFGWYNFAIGAGALPASIIFGLVWQKAGARAAFGFGALLACLAAILLCLLIPAKTSEQGN